MMANYSLTPHARNSLINGALLGKKTSSAVAVYVGRRPNF